MIKGPKLRLKAIAPRMVQKTLRELSKYTQKNVFMGSVGFSRAREYCRVELTNSRNVARTPTARES
jgi:hypothetical protein